jgi:pimeloyl-ACP methyl ester carboxylesterase
MRVTPTAMNVTVNGVSLALWDWPGPGRTLLFVHATGYHSRCWDQVIALLPDCQCIALDLRGHGHSDKPAPLNDWRIMGQDVAMVARTLNLNGVVGIGHSMGGHAVTLAAALEPDAFARLVLIDPVVFAPERYTGARAGEHFVARRRDRWPSVEAMMERFADRPPFNAWSPGVLRDYCDYGLLPAEDGDGYVLACPPAFEAACYQTSSAVGSNIYAEIARIEQPTLVVRAVAGSREEGGGFSASPTVPDLATHFARGRDVEDREHTHFLPMESPAKTAAYIRGMLTDGAADG